LRVTARFDDKHRLGARRRARRRHEFARVTDRLDVEQDGACAAIEREVIEQIGKIDIDAVTDGDDG
jgi:hypothetical protein